MKSIDALPLPKQVAPKTNYDDVLFIDLSSFKPEQRFVWSRDDKGLSRLYSEVFKNKHRFNVDANVWMEYDGKRWKEDPGGHSAGADYMKLHDSLVVYSSKIEDRDASAEYRKFIDKYASNRKMKDVLECAKNINVIHSADLDQKRGILNVQNGTLNLKTGVLYPHNPNDMLTHVCGANFEHLAGTAQYDAFGKFMLDITDNRADLAEYIQRIFGYGLTDETDQECGFLFLGEKSRNGKTTLLDAVNNAMGDYGIAIDPATLARKQFSNSSAPTPDMAVLRGARMVRVGEPEKGMVLDASRFKQLTGNSMITARKLHQDIIRFLPTFKIIFDSNYELEISDMTIFRSGRMIVIPFDRYFSEDERDTGLKERFRQQEYADAILYWCYEGYQKYRHSKLKNKPKSVTQATERFRKNSDRMEQFLDECMRESSRNASAKATYEKYCEWCRATGKNPLGRNNFFAELRKLGILEERGKVGGLDTKGVVVGYEVVD